MKKDLKFYAGVALFTLSWLMPPLGLWVATMSLPVAVKATTVALLTIGGPEVVALVSVALLGKQAFDALCNKLKAVLGRMVPQGSVSRTRYRIGLVLALITIIPTYVQGYAPHLLPDSSPARLYVNVAADLLFLFSLFVLGGGFWDKLRALFLYDAKADFLNTSVSVTPEDSNK